MLSKDITLTSVLISARWGSMTELHIVWELVEFPLSSRQINITKKACSFFSTVTQKQFSWQKSFEVYSKNRGVYCNNMFMILKTQT